MQTKTILIIELNATFGGDYRSLNYNTAAFVGLDQGIN